MFRLFPNLLLLLHPVLLCLMQKLMLAMQLWIRCLIYRLPWIEIEPVEREMRDGCRECGLLFKMSRRLNNSFSRMKKNRNLIGWQNTES